MIFDTDILVWYVRKRSEAAGFIEAVPFGERCISIVSYLELLYGCRNRNELRDAEEFATGGLAEIVPLTPDICAGAQRIMLQFVLSRSPNTNDTLVAATALRRGDVLATGNVKHYTFIAGLVIKPFKL